MAEQWSTEDLAILASQDRPPIVFNSISVKPSNRYRWEPQPDITAHELALAMPALLSHAWNAGQIVDALDLYVRRHFRLLGPTE